MRFIARLLGRMWSASVVMAEAEDLSMGPSHLAFKAAAERCTAPHRTIGRPHPAHRDYPDVHRAHPECGEHQSHAVLALLANVNGQ